MIENDMSEARDAGRQIVAEMLGEPFLHALDAHARSGQFGGAAAEIALESAFGHIWARPRLDRRSRSLVTLGILMALRMPDELKNHVRAGLANGLTPIELEEALMQGIPYAGFPAFSVAARAAAEVLKEKGMSNAPTAGERGLYT